MKHPLLDLYQVCSNSGPSVSGERFKAIMVLLFSLRIIDLDILEYSHQSFNVYYNFNK